MYLYIYISYIYIYIHHVYDIYVYIRYTYVYIHVIYIWDRNMGPEWVPKLIREAIVIIIYHSGIEKGKNRIESEIGKLKQHL